MILATLAQPVTVEAVTPVEKSATVYNFAVDKTHTYFVGNSGVWVHNQCALTNNLRALIPLRSFSPRVVANARTLGHEYEDMVKYSKYTGRKIEHLANSSGIDGYIDPIRDARGNIIGGEKMSLKHTTRSNPNNVVAEIQRSQTKAFRNNYRRGDITTIIGAPNCDARDLLGSVSDMQRMDRVIGNDNTINRVVVFCKNGIVVHLDAP